MDREFMVEMAGCFAKTGSHVIGIDIDENKVNNMSSFQAPAILFIFRFFFDFPLV
jgi:hypothetical protein